MVVPGDAASTADFQLASSGPKSTALTIVTIVVQHRPRTAHGIHLCVCVCVCVCVCA
jgi:hypothetical protein